jgi:cell division protein FtsQ
MSFLVMFHNEKLYVQKRHSRFKVELRSSVSYFFKVSLVACSCIGLIWCGKNLYNPVRFPIRYVKILGNGSDAAHAALREALKPFEKNKLFYINLKALTTQIKQWTWVERVTLWHLLPGTLVIRLYTRIPIAIFQPSAPHNNRSPQLLDKTGYAFDAPEHTIIKDLPILVGTDEQRSQLIQGYYALDALLKSHTLRIAQIHLDPENRYSVTLTNGIQLLLGHLMPYIQLQKLLDAHPNILQQAHKIALLDLRYPTGMAVTWRESTV